MTKPRGLIRATIALVGAGTALLLASNAHAALDEVLAAKAPDVTLQRIGGHTLRVRTRGTLKEFADESGKVFAAHWTGRVNMPELLGTHMAAYQTALDARRVRNHHLVHITTPDLTVDAVAYGRMFRGTVVLNQKLPAGVTHDALR